MSKSRANPAIVSLLPAALAAILALGPVTARAAAASIPPDAQALIEKHVSWLGGWAALDALNDVTLEGKLEVAGLSGTIAVRLRRDGRALTEYDLGVLKGREGLAGDGGWEVNVSGQLEAMGSDKMSEQTRNLDRTFCRHLRGEGVAVSAGAFEEKEGRRWAVLRFVYPGGSAYELLVDPDTGESLWSRGVEDGRITWARQSDLRQVGGVRFAFRQETFAENPLENQVVVWERAVVNTGLPDELFARPGQAAKAARLPAGIAVTSWIPFELFARGYIYLRGQVNGHETDILLDSGAGMTVLNAATAKQVGLESSGSLAAQGTGGTVEAGLVQGVTLKIGELEIGPLTAAVVDLSELEQRMGRPLPVILGKELFHAFVVDIDYPHLRLRLHEPETFQYEGPGRRLELLPAEDGHKDLRLSVEGLEPAVFGLDTGQGSEITLFRRYTEAHRLLEGRRLSQRKGGGVGGTNVVDVGTLRSLEIAGFRFENVPASFDRSERTAFDTALKAGNLGTGILRRFRVLFDYARDALYLEPGPAMDAPFGRDKTGLALVPDGDAVKVLFVSPGSPAAAAGWREGERVAALDGRPFGPGWIADWQRLHDAPDGTTIRLTMADGSERTLVLSGYF